MKLTHATDPKAPRPEALDRRFHTVNGELTAYALACGYVTRREMHGGQVSVELWEEGNTYHVRLIDWRRPEPMRRVWKTTDVLINARRMYVALYNQNVID